MRGAPDGTRRLLALACARDDDCGNTGAEQRERRGLGDGSRKVVIVVLRENKDGSRGEHKHCKKLSCMHESSST